MDLSRAHREMLAEARIAAGMSQTALADRLHTTTQRICRLELGHVNCSLGVLRRWCKILGFDVEVIIRPTAEAAARARPG